MNKLALFKTFIHIGALHANSYYKILLVEDKNLSHFSTQSELATYCLQDKNLLSEEKHSYFTTCPDSFPIPHNSPFWQEGLRQNPAVTACLSSPAVSIPTPNFVLFCLQTTQPNRCEILYLHMDCPFSAIHLDHVLLTISAHHHPAL